MDIVIRPKFFQRFVADHRLWVCDPVALFRGHLKPLSLKVALLDDMASGNGVLGHQRPVVVANYPDVGKNENA